MKLYNWQKKALREWKNHKYQGIINAVTGSGKTMMALACIRLLQDRYPDLRVRIVAPTIALANQWRQVILRDNISRGTFPGFFGDGIRDDADCPMMIYVANSARDGLAVHIRTDFALGRPVLLICDECHRYLSTENYKMFSFLDTGKTEDQGKDRLQFPLYHCLGLSATPFDGERDGALKRVLGDEILRYDFEEAADEGVIVPHVICQIQTSFLQDERIAYADICDRVSKTTAILYKTYPWMKSLPPGQYLKELRKLAKGADMDPSDPAAALLLLMYQRKSLIVSSKARIDCCMSLLERLRPSQKIIVFCEHIEQAENLQRRILRSYGRICSIYHSGLTKNARRRNLDDFREDRARILISCRALDEGLDVPNASVGIVLSSSAVTRQRIQRLGRIVRTDPRKDHACLYYIYIRESTENAAYLPMTDHTQVFDLKYYSAEDDFSNDLYLYSAIQLFSSDKSLAFNKAGTSAVSFKKTSVFSEAELAELRKCILDGMCRPDYLLPESVQLNRLASASETHERNYWRIMRLIGRKFRMLNSPH